MRGLAPDTLLLSEPSAAHWQLRVPAMRLFV